MIGLFIGRHWSLLSLTRFTYDWLEYVAPALGIYLFLPCDALRYEHFDSGLDSVRKIGYLYWAWVDPVKLTGFALTILCCTFQSTVLQFLEWKPFIWIGSHSYGLYILFQFVSPLEYDESELLPPIRRLRHALARGEPFCMIAYLVISCVITLSFAYVSMQLVETPLNIRIRAWTVHASIEKPQPTLV